MVKKVGELNNFIALSIVCILLSVAIVPITMAMNVDRIQGFDKGPSYKPVVPLKKTTFVNFDEESYLTDPYTIASDLALSEWSYADSAVIAVIDETFEKPNILTEGEVSGSIPAYAVDHKQFEVEQPVIGTGGTYKSFQITDEHYKYVVAELSWPNRMDLDLQLYDNKLGMVDNAAGSYSDPQVEIVGSYIHNYGKWQLSVTAVPKKGMYATMNEDPQDGGLFKGTAIKELVKTLKNTGDVDVWLYPGTIAEIISTPPFGCRDAEFTLSWDNPNLRLGFTILDPVGTEICSSLTREELSSGEVEGLASKTSIS